jgi:hypothetical protein
VADHPHSPHASLVLTAEQYDPLACFTRHRERIVHVHRKDVDGQGSWQPMGKGICDFPGLISEEESEIVWTNLPGAIAGNRAYFRSWGW